MAVLSLASTTAEQVAWLRAVAPTYLITYPSALHAILAMLARDGRGLPTLREVRTVGETLSPATRGLCRDVLDLPIVDAYSAQEVGYVALQCPDAAPDDDPDGVRYHVQAERLLVEVLRDDGAPCAPGEIGRVVVTDLHNFATPLLRYELGDYAEVGPPCRCGRGLPVLRRIVGRTRNMLVYPDGRTVWPTFTIACRAASPYDAIQLVQERPDALRLRVVPDPAAGPVDHPALIAALRQCFGYPFAVTIEEVAALGRTPAGKLEEFISTLAPPR
jgi:phenylacetate-CoA ligase